MPNPVKIGTLLVCVCMAFFAALLLETISSSSANANRRHENGAEKSNEFLFTNRTKSAKEPSSSTVVRNDKSTSEIDTAHKNATVEAPTGSSIFTDRKILEAAYEFLVLAEFIRENELSIDSFVKRGHVRLFGDRYLFQSSMDDGREISGDFGMDLKPQKAFIDRLKQLPDGMALPADALPTSAERIFYNVQRKYYPVNCAGMDEKFALNKEEGGINTFWWYEDLTGYGRHILKAEDFCKVHLDIRNGSPLEFEFFYYKDFWDLDSNPPIMTKEQAIEIAKHRMDELSTQVTDATWDLLTFRCEYVYLNLRSDKDRKPRPKWNVHFKWKAVCKEHNLEGCCRAYGNGGLFVDAISGEIE